VNRKAEEVNRMLLDVLGRPEKERVIDVHSSSSKGQKAAQAGGG
jgi:hypothetical protein